MLQVPTTMQLYRISLQYISHNCKTQLDNYQRKKREHNTKLETILYNLPLIFSSFIFED